ncbi:hypothetical protein K7X08_007687 [Anisodus acutangulus]|uniref:Cobalamin-independent methionine synthase MetE C-terminal/archaeal domain-containing protein n=1 Tax=Anisodus acutangulus TaxID=402998 RepID=A0A9Q1R065_9SOLA|nr:hypothetical protein K7X08_007687 [Anisodus acutangulus]
MFSLSLTFLMFPLGAFKTLTALKGVPAFGFDLVRGTQTLDLIKGSFPSGKYLFAGVSAALQGSDHRRATNVSARLDAQQKKLNLPVLPTTTIGSFPQAVELGEELNREYKAKKRKSRRVLTLREELDIDVLVHGEPERNDMVEYFGEQLSGFAFTANGWVQSYGSRCVKPPIIYGDVSRPNPMMFYGRPKTRA